MKILTQEQAGVLLAFLDAFDLYVTGYWPVISDGMRDDFGIADPEAALADAKAALE